MRPCDRSAEPAAEPGHGPGRSVDETLKETAARLRNLLDQKTGAEKRTLRRYLAVLENRLSRGRN